MLFDLSSSLFGESVSPPTSLASTPHPSWTPTPCNMPPCSTTPVSNGDQPSLTEYWAELDAQRAAEDALYPMTRKHRSRKGKKCAIPDEDTVSLGDEDLDMQICHGATSLDYILDDCYNPDENDLYASSPLTLDTANLHLLANTALCMSRM